MVEGVEELGPELDPQSLPNLRVFVNANIPIVDPWPVEKAVIGIAEPPLGRRNIESIIVKPPMVIPPEIIRNVERTDEIGPVETGRSS